MNPEKILSAFERKATCNHFYSVMNFLEIYIEKANFYSDWQERGQIKDKFEGYWKDKDSQEVKDYFLAQLFGLRSFFIMNNGKNGFSKVQEELKTEFYKWIDSTEIKADNCPTDLKSILFDFHEILEGRGDEWAKKMSDEASEEIASWSEEKRQYEFQRGFSAVNKKFRRSGERK